jgi:hypothetical protein
MPARLNDCFDPVLVAIKQANTGIDRKAVAVVRFKDGVNMSDMIEK